MKKELRANVWLLIVCLLTTVQLSAEKSESKEFFVGITCPGDKWVDCDAELWSLYQYGDAYFKTYDGTFKLPEPKEHWHLNECNTGYIERTWKHKAYGKWYECTQTIHVGNSNQGSDIYWPKEGLVLEGCNPNILPENLPAYYNKPHYNTGSCDMMVDTYKDQIFSFGGGCKKIIRKWTVINWCEYVPNTYPKKGYHEYYQTIKISNNEVPHVYDNPVIEINATNCEGTYVSVPDLQVGGGDCDAGHKITNNSAHAQYGGADASGYYPVGMHTIHYEVEYGCGLSKNFTQVIKVNNNLAPVPICVSGLSIALMPVDEDRDGTPEDGSVLIWAKDIDFKSYHPCNLDLTYSFYPDTLVMSHEFTCATVGVNQLSVYVSDTNGNQSYCKVEIFVQNNAANIPGCNANGLAEDAEGEEADAEEDVDGDDAEDNDDQEGDQSEGEDQDEVYAEHDTEDAEGDGENQEGDQSEGEDQDEVYGEHDTEDAEGDGENQDGEDAEDNDGEDNDEDQEGGEGHESESDTTGHTDQDTSDLSMIYGNMMSMHGEALSASIMFEGESYDVAGQLEYETVMVSTIVDSFINDFGETLYITDFSYEEVPIEGTGTTKSPFEMEAFVGESGEYSAADIPMGQTVNIVPSVNAAEYLANISTADGIILFEHITGINRITDPHILLAADIDGDLDIDFDDVEFLIDYISGDLPALPNQEWLFADAQYSFENSESPWSESFFTNEIFVDQQMYEMDFIGVQIGDLGDKDLENRTTIDDLRRQVDQYLGKTFTSDVSISPNPFINEIQLTVESTQTEMATLTLFDLAGKLILEKQVILESGQNKKTIELTDSSYSGTIIYRLSSPTHEHRGKLIRLR